MVTVPHRLLPLPFVSVKHHSADLIVLSKRVTEEFYERPSYLSMHALSMVHKGEQVVSTASGTSIRLGPGDAGLMQQGMYSITDLVSDSTGVFEATVVFFSNRLLQQILDATKPGNDNQQYPIKFSAPTLSPTVGIVDPPTWLHSLLDQLQNTSETDLLPCIAGLVRVPRKPIREFMLAHYDKPLSVVDFAFMTGQSVRSFRRNFKTRFGESPKQWLKRRRLERARHLLATQQLRVNEVANQVGYSSSSHFIEAFKTQFGNTPGEEQQQHG